MPRESLENQRGRWSERGDLNSRPPVPQTGALTELRYAPKPCCSCAWIYTLKAMKQAVPSRGPGSALGCGQDPMAILEFLEDRAETPCVHFCGLFRKTRWPAEAPVLRSLGGDVGNLPLDR
jgi:hypothetical protein